MPDYNFLNNANKLNILGGNYVSFQSRLVQTRLQVVVMVWVKRAAGLAAIGVASDHTHDAVEEWRLARTCLAAACLLVGAIVLQDQEAGVYLTHRHLPPRWPAVQLVLGRHEETELARRLQGPELLYREAQLLVGTVHLCLVAIWNKKICFVGQGVQYIFQRWKNYLKLRKNII